MCRSSGHSPTQPFPTKPAPFARQSFTADDINPHLLTQEQYEALKARMAIAINGTGPQGGLFNRRRSTATASRCPAIRADPTGARRPPIPSAGWCSSRESIRWRCSPHRREDPTGRRGWRRWRRRDRRSSRADDQGQRAYPQYCAACHGADQRGAIAGVPSLVGVTDRIDAESLRTIVSRGAQQHAPDHRRHQRRDRRDPRVPRAARIRPVAAVAAAAAARGGPAPLLPPGPVVASGGAPQPPLPARYGGPFYPGLGGTAGNRPWPDDVEAAKLPTRYQSGYNVMGTSTKPPYTTITAYDLNTGEIKWQVPNGDDPATVEMTTTGGPCERRRVRPQACATRAASARATAWSSRSPACCSRTARTASRAPMTSIPARSCGRARPPASRSASRSCTSRKAVSTSCSCRRRAGRARSGGAQGGGTQRGAGDADWTVRLYRVRAAQEEMTYDDVPVGLHRLATPFVIGRSSSVTPLRAEAQGASPTQGPSANVISGIVHDSTGGAIVGASVTARVASGAERQTTSDFVGQIFGPTGCGKRDRH